MFGAYLYPVLIYVLVSIGLCFMFVLLSYTILFSLIFFYASSHQFYSSPFPYPITKHNTLLQLPSLILYVSVFIVRYLYILLFSSNPGHFWPRMFYRSGWLRCVGFNYILVCWCGVCVSCWCGVIILYYTLLILIIYLLSSLFLLWSILSSSNLIFPSHSFYTCRCLFIVIYILFRI
jgi:hypothetical protein